MTEAPACMLCGHTAVQLLFAARDQLHHLPGEFWVARCGRCRILRTLPCLSGSTLAAYYPDEYAAHADAGEVIPPPSSRVRRRFGLTRHIWWTPDLPAGAHVLELGSGAGHFVRHALTRGWIVHALEPASGPAERLSRLPGVFVYQRDAEALAVPPRTLDAVFAWMVIEHLTNPAEALRRIAHALKPGGYFVFSVPNAGSWEFRLFREHWYALDVPRHLWHFSPRTLRQLLAQCGLRTERIYHQKTLKNLGGSLERATAGRPRLQRSALALGRVLSNPYISFMLGAALAAVRQGGRLTVVARTMAADGE